VTNATASHLFPPWDSRILSTLNSLVNTFQPMYPINDQSFGIGIGRYPEDIYDGVGTSRGNPWSHPFMMIHELIVYRFLCTSAAAEIVYLTALDALKNQSLLTDPLSQSFYQRFLPSISPGEYSFNTTEFNTVLRGMITFGDSFLSTVQQHAFQNGSISEEFDRSCPPKPYLIAAVY